MSFGRASFLIILSGLAALAVRLALTSPLGHDDIEHLHTAWLVSQGYRPFLDFFQKQSPLFWILLQPAAVLGGTDLLAFALLGRLTMLGALVATTLGVLALGRSIVRPTRWAAPFVLLASATLLYNLVAIRPDGVMSACMVWAVAMLLRRSPRSLVAGGFLLGFASVLLLKAAPSAVVLGVTAALLFRPEGRSRIAGALRSLALVAAGALLAVGPFLLWLHLSGLLEGFWFTNVVFNGWLYSSPLAEDVPRVSRLATVLGAMVRNEPWLPLSVVAGFLLALRLRRPLRAADRTVILLLVLSGVNLLLLIPNHLPFYSYFLLPLLAGIGLSPALLQALLDRFEQHRIEWRAPGFNRGLRVPPLIASLLAVAIAALAVAGFQRFATSEGQIRKLAALPRDKGSFELPEHPVFVVDRHYVWDNVDRYLDTLRRMDRGGALPGWIRERCAEQLRGPMP
ncbi:MAG: hypothetical protein FJ109_08770 [Deltaproteobacteria bacterium]|nr:hypothetical protein [Deltaproteobacteria bacterium]